MQLWLALPLIWSCIKKHSMPEHYRKRHYFLRLYNVGFSLSPE